MHIWPKSSERFSLSRSCVFVTVVAYSNMLCFVLQFLQLPEWHLLAACVVERRQLMQIFRISAILLRISELRGIESARKSLHL